MKAIRYAVLIMLSVSTFFHPRRMAVVVVAVVASIIPATYGTRSSRMPDNINVWARNDKSSPAFLLPDQCQIRGRAGYE